MGNDATITCQHCGATGTARITIGTLGLNRFKCPTCRRSTSLPMPRARRITYWVLLFLVGLGMLAGFSGIAMSILFILLAVALGMDANLRSKQARVVAQAPANSPAAAGGAQLVSPPVAPKRPSRLGYVLYASGTLFFVAGLYIFDTIHPQAGNLAAYDQGVVIGNLLGKALIGSLVVALVLRVLKVPQYGGIALILGGLCFLAFAYGVSHKVAAQQQQSAAAVAAISEMVARYQARQPIAAKQYPIEQYGDTGYALAVFNRDVIDIQKRDTALTSQVSAVGSFEPMSAEMLTDAQRREHAHDQIAQLRVLMQQTNELAHDLIKSVESDIGRTPMTTDEKQQFIQGFDAKAGPGMKIRDAAFQSLDKLMSVEQEMLEIADADHPKLVAGKCVFSSTLALQKFQDDANALPGLVAKSKAAQAEFEQLGK